jgi:hypothetical protein
VFSAAQAPYHREHRLQEVVQQQQQQQQQQPQQQQQYQPGEGPYEPARLVNTLLIDAATGVPLRGTGPLATGHPHELRLNVGRYVRGSLLAFKDALWPDDLLPDTGVWLRAVLMFEEDRQPRVVSLFLPPDCLASLALRRAR